MPEPVRIGLIGAGAVGVFYTSLLQRESTHTTLITRQPHEYAVPIQIDSIHGQRHWAPNRVHAQGDPLDDELDVLIIATKVHASINLVSLVKPYVSKRTVLVLIQNGVFIEDELVHAFSQPVLRALAFICSHRHNYTHIEHIDYGGLTLGVKYGHDQQALIQPVLDIFMESQIDLHIEEDINVAIWKKLVWNVPFNPLSVFYGGVSTDWLLNDPAAFHRVVMMMDEVVAVAQHLELPISHQFREAMILNTRKMTPYKTSMCLDNEAGLPIEIEAILGNFVRFSKQLDIPVPMAESIYTQLIQRLT